MAGALAAIPTVVGAVTANQEVGVLVDGHISDGLATRHVVNEAGRLVVNAVHTRDRHILFAIRKIRDLDERLHKTKAILQVVKTRKEIPRP